MTDKEKAREIVKAVGVFRLGCTNTIPIQGVQTAAPPEDCHECLEAFLDRIKNVLGDDE